MNIDFKVEYTITAGDNPENYYSMIKGLLRDITFEGNFNVIIEQSINEDGTIKLTAKPELKQADATQPE